MPPLNREIHHLSISNTNSSNSTPHDRRSKSSKSTESSNSDDCNDDDNNRSGKQVASGSSLETSLSWTKVKTLPAEHRMDAEHVASSSSSRRMSLNEDLKDDENSGARNGRHDPARSSSEDRRSKLSRPTSSTRLNGTPGGIINDSPPSWPRYSRLWTWIPHVWNKTTGTPPKSETLPMSTRDSQRKFCFWRWNETAASGWHMTKIWVFGMLTPIGIITWMYTHRVSYVLASILVLPSVAILQGSVAILRYRVQFGDSPLPKAPSHGIVKCVSKLKAENSNGYGSADSRRTTSSNGAATNKNNNNSSLLGESATSFQGFVDPEHHHHPQSSTIASPSSAATPLRLLVIGDSLAIGVGQSCTATPVMPETIAKTLSKAMDGRPVLWTCHGAPGASAGWIVRELERSIQQGQFLQASPPYGRAYPGANGGNASLRINSDKNTSFADGDSCSSGDDSSTTQSTEEVSPGGMRPEQDDHQEVLQMWSNRLKEHKIRFDPDVLGPFDIAVVLTGSNDLKSAFFPFLLTGEDAEFRRQAQQRGGGYGNELTRILQVLNRRMRMRLQTLRQTVEAATERVMESVDNIRERMNSHDMNVGTTGPHTFQRRTARGSRLERSSSSTLPDGSGQENKETDKLLEEDEMLEDASHARTSSINNVPHFPMVVLPGMPSRALPIFQTAPLRWLAVPIVDIMDSHKRKLARHHDGEVMFIEAPTCEEIAEYSSKCGVHWEEEMDDRLLLNLRGIKRKQARTIESDMETYFSEKAHSPTPESLPFRRRHHSMFSVDGIHPNDQGYDFWGRYIGHAIVEEWKRTHTALGGSSDFV
jgi:hypothetical protein